jgi:hypothetical protein
MTYFVIDADSDEGTSHPESFRDAPLGAGPESILSIVVMDSGLALRAPRNDGLIFIRDTSGICSRCRVVICPSGGFLTGLSSLISDFPKNISVPTHPKSPLELFVSHPTEGRIMIVTNAGWDAVDAAAFCARRDRRASRKTCERSTAR